jgi:acyl-CoA synthetase (AMP-forming)/AMP-acid ligase II
MVPVTVQRALTLTARRHPGKVAIRYRDQALTYGDLDVRSNRLAHALIGMGLARGDRVGAMLPNCPDYVVLAMACAKAVLCMVPINYRFTRDEIKQQLSDCDARAMVYGAEFAAKVREATAQGGTGILLCRAQDGGAAVERWLGEHDFDASVAVASAEPLPMDAAETDLFYLGYTSGTTGKPKGAMVSQRNRALAYHAWALEFGIRHDDVALHSGPFHHTAPFTFTLTQLSMGGEVVIMDAFDAPAAVQAIKRHRVTWSFMVPFMLERLLETTPQTGQAEQNSLRMLISGASPLPTRTKEAVVARFPGLALHEFYGATEAGVVTNLRPQDQARKIRCVGQPVADIEIEIRSADDGSVQPVGTIGEIWMRGPTLFAGYFNAPEKTAEAMQGDWCTLGDIGRIDDENFVYLIDRSKDVIKSGGVNVYPIEIEEIILHETDIRECAVVGLPDSRWGEAVHAFVVLRADRPGVLDRVRDLCREHLADYKRPKDFHIVMELPRNANGKVLKRELRLSNGTLS